MSTKDVPLQSAAPGLYVHVPFCSAICPYCDFMVLAGGRERREQFVQSLCREMALWRDEFAPFDTVYLGGGTPSILLPAQLTLVFETLHATLAISDTAWISLEANPEDITAETLALFRDLGVDTLSIGVQSFDEHALAFLGRRHSAAQARDSVALANASGFPIVSCDLIYGLPGQSLADWRRDLATAIALQPTHISCYQLTVHKRTAFGRLRARGELSEMAEDDQAEMFLTTHRVLNDAEYAGYEVSNFAATPAHRSRHNRKYWDHTAYLGLGPSSHSFSGHTRWWNERRLGRWQGRIAAGERPVAGSETLDTRELVLERLMLGLRTYDGVDLRALAARYGFDVQQANRARFVQWDEQRLVRTDGDWLRPTLRGLAIADYLARSIDLH